MRALLRVTKFTSSEKSREKKIGEIFNNLCRSNSRRRRRFQFFNFVFGAREFLSLPTLQRQRNTNNKKSYQSHFSHFRKKIFFNLLEKQTYKIKKIELTQQKLIFGLSFFFSLFSDNLKQQFMSFKLTSLIINCKLTCFKTTHH